MGVAPVWYTQRECWRCTCNNEPELGDRVWAWRQCGTHNESAGGAHATMSLSWETGCGRGASVVHTTRVLAVHMQNVALTDMIEDELLRYSSIDVAGYFLILLYTQAITHAD